MNKTYQEFLVALSKTLNLSEALCEPLLEKLISNLNEETARAFFTEKE